MSEAMGMTGNTALSAGTLDRDLGAATELARREATREAGDANRIGSEFEALLLKQVVKALRDTVPDGGMMGDGPEAGMYDHFIEEALSSALNEGGGIGLRDLFAPRGHERAARRDPGEPSLAPALATASRARLSWALREAEIPARQSPTPDGLPARAPSPMPLPSLAPEPPVLPHVSGGLDDATRPLAELLPPTGDAWLERPDARRILESILSQPASSESPASSR